MSDFVGQPPGGAGLDAPGFAERLLAVIDEGRRTATYKLALLMALTECCAEAGTVPGATARRDALGADGRLAERHHA
jgi:hypothetical protein